MREIKTRKSTEIDLRDTFILPYQGKYYMYGTAGFGAFEGTPDGYLVYVGTDLENWDGPYTIFANDGTSWADTKYWAPEVYEINGSFYLFSAWSKAPCEVPDQWLCVLKSDSPMGPFTILNGRLGKGNDPTLYQENGRYYLVHNDGFLNMQVHELASDLSCFIGEGTQLFDRSDEDVTWSVGGPTEGAFTFKTPTGKLLILWSSFCKGNSEKFRKMGFENMDYGTSIAYSESGDIHGPYKQENKLLTPPNMGHVSLFYRFDGQMMLATHFPDDDNCDLGCSYPVFFPIDYDEVQDTLKLR